MTCDYCGRVIEPDETHRNLAEEGGGYSCYNTDCLLRAAAEYGNRDGDESSVSAVEDESDWDSEPSSPGYRPAPIRTPAGNMYINPSTGMWNNETGDRMTGEEVGNLETEAASKEINRANGMGLGGVYNEKQEIEFHIMLMH